MDAKGRILFVIGTLGIITLYWKTGCLFDASTVGDVGKRLIDNNTDALGSSMIRDPLINSDGTKKNQVKQEMRAPGSVASIVASYSLNIDLGQKIIRRQKGVDASAAA